MNMQKPIVIFTVSRQPIVCDCPDFVRRLQAVLADVEGFVKPRVPVKCRMPLRERTDGDSLQSGAFQAIGKTGHMQAGPKTSALAFDSRVCISPAVVDNTVMDAKLSG